MMFISNMSARVCGFIVYIAPDDNYLAVEEELSIGIEKEKVLPLPS